MARSRPLRLLIAVVIAASGLVGVSGAESIAAPTNTISCPSCYEWESPPR